jgi:steroid delta-isomerase-like uncharacterized protein
MAAEEHKALVQRWVDAINNDELATLAGIVDVHFVDHHPLPGQAAELTGLTHAYGTLHTAFPDWRITVDDLLAEADTVVVRSTWSGTQQGEFLSVPPTDQGTFTVPAVDVFRVADGKIVERWGVVDLFGMVQQLGIIPPMGMAGGSTRLE